MAFQSFFATLEPFPYLAEELQQNILRFCDPPTLAATSRVSFAFLQLSSPFLYNHIDLDTPQALSRLFCSSKRKDRQSTLASYLSLLQIQSLTLPGTETIPALGTAALTLSRDRLVLSSPSYPLGRLSLPLLILRLGPVPSKWQPALLSLFDPTHLQIQGRLSSIPLSVNISTNVEWTKIKKLTLVDAALVLDSPRKDVQIFAEEWEMKCVISDEQGDPFFGMWQRDVTLDVRSLKRRGRLPKTVEFEVRTEEQGKEIMEALKGYELLGVLKDRLKVVVRG